MTKLSTFGVGAHEVIVGVDRFKMYSQRQAGFVSLMHFFDAAANRHVSLLNQGCFPTEIYWKIIANTDDLTYNVCAKVSGTFRACCQENIPFGKDLMLIGFSAKSEAWKFTFLNHSTGCTMESELDKDQGTAWSVIVGAERPSIITEIQLIFKTPSLPNPNSAPGCAPAR
jgi:hypothetical protein